MTRPSPQRTDGPPCWLVVTWADACRYRVLSAHPTRGEAAAAAEQRAGAVILFRAVTTAVTRADEF
jgi:hypothetical protein